MYDVTLAKNPRIIWFWHSSSVAVELLKVLICAVLSDTTAEPSDALPQIVTLLPVVSDNTTQTL